MSQYDITVDKAQITAVYDASFSGFTEDSLATTKAYIDYKKTIVVSTTEDFLAQKYLEITGVTGSSQYLYYESQLDTIKEIADKIQENLTDATDLLTLLNVEIGRGTVGEAGLSSTLLLEKNRALTAEGNLLLGVTNEYTRARSVENGFSSSLAFQVSKSKTNENGLSSQISVVEYNRGISAENYITTKLNTEKTTFEAANTGEFVSMSSGDTNVFNANINEQNLRIFGDSSFQQGLSSETFSRSSGQTTEFNTMSNGDSAYNYSLNKFVDKTNTQLSGTSFSDVTTPTYTISSDVNVTNHKLYFGSKWRLSANTTESIFEYNTSGTNWKRIVRFGI